MITKTAEGWRTQGYVLETSGDGLDKWPEIEMQSQMVRPRIKLTTKRLRNISRDSVHQGRERLSTADSVNPRSPEFGKIEETVKV